MWKKRGEISLKNFTYRYAWSALSVCDRLPNIFFPRCQVATIKPNTGQFNTHSRFDWRRKNRFVNTHLFLLHLLYLSVSLGFLGQATSNWESTLFYHLHLSLSFVLLVIAVVGMVFFLFFILNNNFSTLFNSTGYFFPASKRNRIMSSRVNSNRIESKIESSETVA